MTKERPPVLSVLLDNDRKAQFQTIAQGEGRSMGWIIKDMIDRMIEANSIHIYGDSQGGQQIPVNGYGTNNFLGDASDIERVAEIARSELENALTPISNELTSLQAQLAELRARIPAETLKNKRAAKIELAPTN
jgi:hypothetical protein